MEKLSMNNQGKNVFCQPLIKQSLWKNKNIWLLKPNDLNRGRGIQIFDSLETLKTQIKEITSQGINDINVMDEEAEPESLESKKQQKVKYSRGFVIQKYLERPLLVSNRKFDIRVWALVDQDLQVYVFKEGYIRTSSEEFTLDSIDKRDVHLTNIAIQKHYKNYG